MIKTIKTCVLMFSLFYMVIYSAQYEIDTNKLNVDVEKLILKLERCEEQFAFLGIERSQKICLDLYMEEILLLIGNMNPAPGIDFCNIAPQYCNSYNRL